MYTKTKVKAMIDTSAYSRRDRTDPIEMVKAIDKVTQKSSNEVKSIDNITNENANRKLVDMVSYADNYNGPHKSNVNTTQKNVIQALETCNEIIDNNTIGNNLSHQPLKSLHQAVVLKPTEEFINKNTQEYQYDIMRKFINNIPVKTRNRHIYIYNGCFFESVTKNRVYQLIVSQFRDIIKSKTSKFLAGVVDYLFYEPDIVMEDKSIRKDIISFKNGILNIRTGEFFNHNPDFITTYAVMANYIGINEPHTPVFDAFLNQITGGDCVLQERILQIIGYCMTPDTGAKKIFLFQGVGDSGKSVLCRLLQKLFSSSAYFPMKAANLKSRFALADLFGRVLCVCNDMPSEPLDIKATSILKELSGNDTVSSDVKYESSIVFDNTAKIIMVSNHDVVAKTSDEAFYNRIVTVPFKYAVSKSAQDPYLIERLTMEFDGIATKAIHAYWRLVKANYVFLGDYKINEVVDTSNINPNLAMNIYNFVKCCFEKQDDAFVFTQTAYEEFVNYYTYCNKLEFSQFFKKFAFEIYGVSSARKREYANSNPKHGIKGLVFKNPLL